MFNFQQKKIKAIVNCFHFYDNVVNIVTLVREFVMQILMYQILWWFILFPGHSVGCSGTCYQLNDLRPGLVWKCFYASQWRNDWPLTEIFFDLFVNLIPQVHFICVALLISPHICQNFLEIAWQNNILYGSKFQLLAQGCKKWSYLNITKFDIFRCRICASTLPKFLGLLYTQPFCDIAPPC